MQAFIENLLDCDDRNDMKVNTAKTKEMILGPLAQSDLPILSTRGPRAGSGAVSKWVICACDSLVDFGTV